ncbi:FtsX-like permease family protein [Aromatoleum sp.]|uniref:FtsX-like permease family protein n=1 Tax=Aromatoleum sp. TaxID=2307007 RepID=UPI002FC7774A
MNPALARIFLASLGRRRLATALSLVAIALGVALGLAVQLIHTAALDEFGRGMRLVSGEADLQVLGPRDGFGDDLYVSLAQRPEIAEASPILEIEVRLPGREDTLRIFGIDVFRAAAMQSALMPAAQTPAPAAADGGADGEANRDANRDAYGDANGDANGDGDGDGADAEAAGPDRGATPFAALAADALFLSPAARAALALGPGQTLAVQVGTREEVLRVAGSVPAAGVGQRLAVMDIAAAQHVFERVGRITRVDLRLVPGTDPRRAQAALRGVLPPGVELLAPEATESQAAGLSRAYRVNLTMLAAIALLTGGFLVFSTQLLSVVRRRQELAFLRALGLDRRAMLGGLLAEGGVLGLVGGVFGVALGYALGALAVAVVGGDLGAGYFEGVRPQLRFEPLASAAYLGLGVVAGLAGAAMPAREAARLMPARALHAGDEAEVFRSRPRWHAALACLALAAVSCLAPPVGAVPVFGYAAIALILAGAVLVLPGVVRLVMAVRHERRGFLVRLGFARLAAAPGQAVVAAAGVVASVALAAAMAIMVSSFRGSVDDWLSKVLPADLYLRASPSGASGFLTPQTVARIGEIPGIAQAQPVRFDTLRLDDAHLPVTLIARPVADGARIPLVAGAIAPEPERSGDRSAWISEAMADLFGLRVGDPLTLPLGSRERPFRVAGIWRDYARQNGAVVIELADYRALTGDERTNDVAIHLAADARPADVSAALVSALDARTIEIQTPGAIRTRTLAIFDRTFLVTYAMEAVAVLIGLFGISTSFAALATARRKEFGMLRHLGVTRAEIGRLLALEGALSAAVGVIVGLASGGAIALVLVEVVNRQSFHWSMDLRVPVAALAAFAVALVLLAAFAARLAGRHAMRQSAVLAVREDW